jgi:hypothetical protein
MEKKKFIKKAKNELNLFFIKQFVFVFISTIILSFLSLLYNVLVSASILSTLLFLNYLIKNGSYESFGLYKLLYFSRNSQKNLFLSIIVSSLSSYLVIVNFNEIQFYQISGTLFDESEFSIKKYNSLSLLFSILLSIVNYILIDSKLSDLIDDRIYNSEYYFQRIKERRISPSKLKQYLLEQSDTPEFWYVAEKNEEDLANDLFY